MMTTDIESAHPMEASFDTTKSNGNSWGKRSLLVIAASAGMLVLLFVLTNKDVLTNTSPQAGNDLRADNGRLLSELAEAQQKVASLTAELGDVKKKLVADNNRHRRHLCNEETPAPTTAPITPEPTPSPTNAPTIVPTAAPTINAIEDCNTEWCNDRGEPFYRDGRCYCHCNNGFHGTRCQDLDINFRDRRHLSSQRESSVPTTESSTTSTIKTEDSM